MATNPLDLWNTMGWMARGVFLILVFLSVYSLTVSIERWLRYRRARRQSLDFSTKVTPLLRKGRLSEAIDLAKKFPDSHLSQVVSAGLLEFVYDPGDRTRDPDPTLSAQRAMERAVVKTTEDLKRGLPGLATIATTAPFIGLFGTVLGIITAFQGMAVSGSGGLGAVSAGIAEALVTTACGLFVAIPAVWLYNYFTGKVERFRVEMNNSGSELVDFFRKQSLTKAA